MEVFEPSDAEIDAFRQATKPAYDKWAERIGPDLVSVFETTIAEEKGGKDAASSN